MISCSLGYYPCRRFRCGQGGGFSAFHSTLPVYYIFCSCIWFPFSFSFTGFGASIWDRFLSARLSILSLSAMGEFCFSSIWSHTKYLFNLVMKCDACAILWDPLKLSFSCISQCMYISDAVNKTNDVHQYFFSPLIMIYISGF